MLVEMVLGERICRAQPTNSLPHPACRRDSPSPLLSVSLNLLPSAPSDPPFCQWGRSIFHKPWAQARVLCPPRRCPGSSRLSGRCPEWRRTDDS
uniref:Uncharacterized protein n=1 Tax=Anguilla anguilla TaxID=7936 RepID=A0A0E9R3X0_ANGAN